MAILKCKMCGGDIQFNPGDTYGQCDHCGCTTTFPKLPDEQRANLFNRANHFRRQCEFDKAVAAYEHILEEDSTDAEAHWGIVLSKFGIEYVEDPVTHERIPTCHRAQVISILSDEDYQNALQYAPDTHSREIYEQEAKRIAELQKGILAISSQEKPYDVFICYKETDDNGSRTKDSTLAQEIYYQLTNEGYKVFFSRITLEDKLGTEYEPYIFAALNSAKVMLVVGTKPEYFSAVWVKNEWSRYLALMKSDRKRVLIPCYRDMDPYDLPEELSSLQSQDMSKIGFMQDLIHGVKKVLGSDKQSAPNVTVQAAGPGVASLHKRAVLFLEDSDWESAQEYFDRILDIDPEYAPAYIGKVQVKNQARREADLARCTEPLTNNADYQKALRFADDQTKKIYLGYNRAIEERLELKRREAIYREGDALEKRAAVEADFLAAAKQFDAAGDIRDAKERAANCRAKAAAAKAEAERAAEAYRLQMEKERQERARQEEERKQEEERRRQQEIIERDRHKARNKKIVAVFIILALLGAAGYFAYDRIIQPKMRYDQAQVLLDNKQYDEAVTAFSVLGDYNDSQMKVKEAYYQKAASTLAQGNLSEAYDLFRLATGYADAQIQSDAIYNYSNAEYYYRNGQYLDARKAYASAGDFQDAKDMLETISKMLYDEAQEKLESNDLTGAYQILSDISDYADSAEIMAKIDQDYQNALNLWAEGKKTEAEVALEKMLGWSDSEAKLAALREEIGDDAFAAEDYDLALTYYSKVEQTPEILQKRGETYKRINYLAAQDDLALGDLEAAYQHYLNAVDYLDAADQAATIAKYHNAVTALDGKEYVVARAAFQELGDFLDSSDKVEECNRCLYDIYSALLQEGDIAGAHAGFQYISDYSDSAEITARIENDFQSAQLLLFEKKYDEAADAFRTLKNYAGSESLLMECQYQKAQEYMDQGAYDKAAETYEGIPTYKDSPEKANEAHYLNADSLLEAGDTQAAAEEYKNLGTYLDAEQRLVKVSITLADEAMANKDYASALTAYLRLEQTDEIKAKEYQLAQVCYDEGHFAEATSAYESLGQYELSLSRLPVARYAWADQLFKAGDYEKAAEQFALLGGMTDSTERAKESKYQLASRYLASNEFDQAKSLFASITGYSDADTQVKECDYRKANALLSEGKNQEAQEIFEALGVYSDSSTKAEQCIYNQAEALFEAKEYSKAKALYDTITYSDSQTKAKQCVYNQAEALFSSGQYSAAKIGYASIDYKDSKEKANQCAYLEAMGLYDAKKYADAEKLFLELSDYSDSAERAKDSHVQQGNELMQAGDYAGALEFYESVEYGDSAALAARCHYELGHAAHVAGNADDAVAQYAYAVSIPEAREAIMVAAKDYAAMNEIEKAIQTLWLIRDQEDAKNMLMEIGTLKQQTGEKAIAYIAYWVSGEIPDESIEKAFTLDFLASLQEKLTFFSLLPDEINFENACLYEYAMAARAIRQYETAIKVFKQLEGYNDAATQIQETRYQYATLLNKEGKYEKAYSLYATLSGYKDVDIIVKTDENIISAARLASSIEEEVNKRIVKDTSIPKTYEGVGEGFMSSVRVMVTIKDNIITALEVSHDETPTIGGVIVDAVEEQLIGLNEEEALAKVDNLGADVMTSATFATVTRGAVKEALTEAFAKAKEDNAADSVSKEGSVFTEKTTLNGTGYAKYDAAELKHDGTYEGSGDGFMSSVRVMVTIKDNIITALEVSHDEMPAIGGVIVDAVEEQLIGLNEEEAIAKVDAMTGATFTKRAIEEALTEAFAKAKEDNAADSVPKEGSAFTEKPTPNGTGFAKFEAAELESFVTVDTYVQDKQSWWADRATIYCQSEDGAYFLYELPISQEDYDKLVPGTKIRVNGYKGEWAGEVEIVDASYEVIEGEPYIAKAEDVTALLGTDELIKHMNKLVAFNGMTVEAYDETGAAFAYKDPVGKTDDLYFKVSKDGVTYGFCVEFYLRGNNTEVYKAVEGLKVGDVVDLEGYLYWYNGPNPHIISVKYSH